MPALSYSAAYVRLTLSKDSSPLKR